MLFSHRSLNSFILALSFFTLFSLKGESVRFEIVEIPTPRFTHRHPEIAQEIHLLGSAHTVPYDELPATTRGKIEELSRNPLVTAFFETVVGEEDDYNTDALDVLTLDQCGEELTSKGLSPEILAAWKKFYQSAIIPSLESSLAKLTTSYPDSVFQGIKPLLSKLKENTYHPVACLEILRNGITWKTLLQTHEGMDTETSTFFREEQALETDEERFRISFPTDNLTSPEIFTQAYQDFKKAFLQSPNRLSPDQRKVVAKCLYKTMTSYPQESFAEILNLTEGISRFVSPETVLQRNSLWEKRIADFIMTHPGKTPFIVGGIAHLGGEGGLFQRLLGRFGGTIVQHYERQTLKHEEKTVFTSEGEIRQITETTVVAYEPFEKALSFNPYPGQELVMAFNRLLLKQNMERVVRGESPQTFLRLTRDPIPDHSH